VNVPSAPSYGDVQALQSAASATELVLFLSQFEALSGTDAATQQLATSLLNDARNVELALNGFAAGEAVILPGNIVGNDQLLAQQMIAAVRAGDVDQAFSTLIVQAQTSLLGQFQTMAVAAQDQDIREFATSVIPTLQNDLDAVLGTATLAPVSEVASSTTLDANDLNTTATYYAINIMERFLGQLTALVTTRRPIGLYAAKLIGDHQGGLLALGSYAASTSTYLPAMIPSADAPMADAVVAALGRRPTRGSARYDRVYLKEMIMGHFAALKFTDSVVASAQNPTIRQFAANVGPTINMHLVTARTLYRL